MDERVEPEVARRLMDEATKGPWKRDRNWTVTGPGNDWDRHFGRPGVGLEEPSEHDTRICFVHGPGGVCTANRPVGDFNLIVQGRNLAYTVTLQAAEIAALRAELAEEISTHRADLSAARAGMVPAEKHAQAIRHAWINFYSPKVLKNYIPDQWLRSNIRLGLIATLEKANIPHDQAVAIADAPTARKTP